MAEKLFVIMEVKKISSLPGTPLGKYYPVDKKAGEYLSIEEDRVIPASRLRQRKPKEGETYLDFHSRDLWTKANFDFESVTAWVLDPPPEEKPKKPDKIDQIMAAFRVTIADILKEEDDG